MNLAAADSRLHVSCIRVGSDALACDSICREGVMNPVHISEVILQPPIQQQQQQQQQQQAQAPPQHRVPVNINILMEDSWEVIIGYDPLPKQPSPKQYVENMITA